MIRDTHRIRRHNQPVSSIRYKLVCGYSEDSNQSGHLHSLISLSFQSDEMSDPWLPIECP